MTIMKLSKETSNDDVQGSLSYLSLKEKEFLKFLVSNRIYEIVPIEISKKLGVTNKTVINRCAKLASNGFLIPNIVKERIRSYSLSDFAKNNAKQIIAL